MSSTPFVRTASIESLHLSFLFSLSELFFVFSKKRDLAQDCPLSIPGIEIDVLYIFHLNV
ncbi:hypothetical protein Lal_00035832 [Lupinus albus]|nr:hypothetical protein Lal_00035831 [Lupinus albus]KAF1862731.1 hypothetical protein Lal_00035832 [Lupinus albus]